MTLYAKSSDASLSAGVRSRLFTIAWPNAKQPATTAALTLEETSIAMKSMSHALRGVVRLPVTSRRDDQNATRQCHTHGVREHHQCVPLTPLRESQRQPQLGDEVRQRACTHEVQPSQLDRDAGHPG